MKNLIFVTLSAVAFAGFSTPATAHPTGNHAYQHDQINQQHGDVHDQVDQAHQDAHDQGLSFEEHAQLHDDLN